MVPAEAQTNPVTGSLYALQFPIHRTSVLVQIFQIKLGYHHLTF